MKQEDKQLLLKDLCARLPYGVIVDYKENEFEIPHWKITTIYPETMDGWIEYDEKVGVGSKSVSRHFKIGEVKPYLRPLDSMTEDEKIELLTVSNFCPVNEDIYNGFIRIIERSLLDIADIATFIKWLCVNHFDFLGLIPMGLALEAPKDMYK